MIDLHSHTNESDGTDSPAELVDRAVALKLEALAITDHDTFAGFDAAIRHARAKDLELVCGIELSARLDMEHRRHTVHLLGYFLHEPPAPEFRAWLEEVLADRRDRNVRLIARLQSMGVAIELAEVEQIGRTLTGRPHFARILVDKGYVVTSEQAFRDYLGEDAPGYIQRHAPHAAMAIQRVIGAGGFPVLAHPVRLGLRDRDTEQRTIKELVDAGLRGIEVFHSDHLEGDVARYACIAKKFGLASTGGSDYHGQAKPAIQLGSGRNRNLRIPAKLLQQLRQAAKT